jgi:hypothetical protein
MEGLGDGDCVCDGETVCVAVAACVGVRDCEALCVPDWLGVSVLVGVTSWLPVCDGVGLADWLRVPEPLDVARPDIVPDWLRVPEREADSVELGDLVCDEDAPLLRDCVGVTPWLSVWLRVTDIVDEYERLGVKERLRVCVALCVAA